MNITYECNNRCIFCISHNTRNITCHVEKPLEIIKAVNNEYKFSKNDLFIVNGGEPTTSKYFESILAYLLATEINIVVYTNGRTLSKYLQYTKNSRIRWIIAYYGLNELHDKYTGRKGSFLETFISLQSIDVKNRSNVSVKFLIEDKEQIEQFKELSEMLANYNEIHLSLILNDNIKKRLKLGKYVSVLIKELFKTHIVKLSNLPLCTLDSDIKINFENLIVKNINEYYFIDEKANVKKIDYDRNHKWLSQCDSCKVHNICCDNYKKYRALKIYKDEISLEEE
ncbi:MAG: radical SAM protein [Treponema sp.]|nr:radical SAM protein [Treponema sp.]